MVFIVISPFMGEMDLYDRGILTILRDEKSRTFQQLLSEAGFSLNTLRKHLNELVDQGLVARRKRPRKNPGRPLFTYRLQKGVESGVSTLLNPSKGLMVVSFEELSRFCKREKDGSARKSRIIVRLFHALKL